MEATIFRDTAHRLGLLLREAAIDHEAFERPMALCELARCRATCCHDGVILSDEEARILGGMAEGIVTGPDGRHRTATVAAGEEERADDFPGHFPKTRCVFLDREHRCTWQLRANREGRPPWSYKPISCWMHPLLLKRTDGRPLLTILPRDEDQEQFASFTPCGKVDRNGRPGREVLRQELEMLGELSGRDFYGELNAPPGFSPAAKDITSG